MTLASALGAIVIITYLEHYFGEAKDISRYASEP